MAQARGIEKPIHKCCMLQGIDAITTTLLLQPKRLTIIGKDFYESGHQDHYKSKHVDNKLVRKKTNKSHNLKKNKLILIRLLEIYDNIEIDDITRSSLISISTPEEINIITQKTNFNL